MLAAVAVLGIALIAMGEDIGSEMGFRTMGHLVSIVPLLFVTAGHNCAFSTFDCLQLRYGEPMIKQTVPLALALLSASNPRLQYLDTLSKFSHDSDPEVAHNAILAMGVVGAGC